MTIEQQQRLRELVEQRAPWQQLLGAIIKGLMTDEDAKLRALGRAVYQAVQVEAERQRQQLQ
jgi:hypothetical protein